MAERRESSKLEIPVVDGKAIFPRHIRCECGHLMRHRPGHLYGCPDCKYTFLVEIEDEELGRCDQEEGQQVTCVVREEQALDHPAFVVPSEHSNS